MNIPFSTFYEAFAEMTSNQINVFGQAKTRFVCLFKYR